MKMNILIVTSTRADFSLLKNLYKKLNASYTTKMLVTWRARARARGWAYRTDLRGHQNANSWLEGLIGLST